MEKRTLVTLDTDLESEYEVVTLDSTGHPLDTLKVKGKNVVIMDDQLSSISITHAGYMFYYN